MYRRAPHIRVNPNEFDWSVIEEAEAAAADQPGLVDVGEVDEGEPWWTEVVTGGVSIVDKIIGAATGQTDKPSAAAPTVDPFAQPTPKTGLAAIPTWAWLAGGAAVIFLVMRRR